MCIYGGCAYMEDWSALNECVNSKCLVVCGDLSGLWGKSELKSELKLEL